MNTISWEPFKESSSCGPAVKRVGCVAVHVALPEVQPEGTEICITDDTITVEGRRKSEPAADADTTRRGADTTDNFRWSIGLPGPVEIQEAEAVLEDGMLIITLPKSNRGDARPRAEAQSSCEDSA